MLLFVLTKYAIMCTFFCYLMIYQIICHEHSQIKIDLAHSFQNGCRILSFRYGIIYSSITLLMDMKFVSRLSCLLKSCFRKHANTAFIYIIQSIITMSEDISHQKLSYTLPDYLSFRISVESFHFSYAFFILFICHEIYKTIINQN